GTCAVGVPPCTTEAGSRPPTNEEHEPARERRLGDVVRARPRVARPALRGPRGGHPRFRRPERRAPDARPAPPGRGPRRRPPLGVLAAAAGAVRWDGAALDLEARREVGYMPEERGLYPKMKVADQLQFFAELHGMTAVEAREAVERWTDRLGVGHRRGDAVEK